MAKRSPKATTSRASKSVVELFAGVGGFRLGLEKNNAWRVEWSNQWEPGSRHQEASSCYEHRFGSAGHVCEDIAKYLDWQIDGVDNAIAPESKKPLPSRVGLLVGGFPCQDYSVAKPLSQSAGLSGKKGVLWWEIYRLIEHTKPKYALLENVDRLLKSPSRQRGRDFAVMLSCLNKLGYVVQWRVINAAEYGHAQRRRRIFILAEKAEPTDINPSSTIISSGVLAKAFPASVSPKSNLSTITLSEDPYEVSENFNKTGGRSPWGNAGVMVNGVVYTMDVVPSYKGPQKILKDVLEKGRVSPEFYIEKASLKSWKFLKGAKKVPRVDKNTGHSYDYSEGPVAFPDPLTKPSRTILTSEGGRSPSRSTHVVRKKSGRLRRLTPVELERLQEFPDDWTKFDSAGRQIRNQMRGFFMGNALVVGIVAKISKELASARDRNSSTL